MNEYLNRMYMSAATVGFVVALYQSAGKSHLPTAVAGTALVLIAATDAFTCRVDPSSVAVLGGGRKRRGIRRRDADGCDRDGRGPKGLGCNRLRGWLKTPQGSCFRGNGRMARASLVATGRL
jgi:hypothetical protein